MGGSSSVRPSPATGSSAGYASTCKRPFEVEDWLGIYTEEFASGAFIKTLEE